MIDKLTKENLQKLGFKEADVNELYNSKEPYNLQCNEGNIFVSKDENKLFTGIDMYRKIYFTEKNINFPFSCPDLFDEYFELSLAKFFEKQKAELSIHFDEKTQFDKFILLDTIKSKEIIKDNKEYIKEHPDRRWIRREKANNILETYIQFLDNKLFVNQKTNSTKPDPTFLDYIYNVKDKEVFAEELKTLFITADLKDFGLMIYVLSTKHIFLYNKFAPFFRSITNYFDRSTKDQNNLNDLINAIRKDIKNKSVDKESLYSEKINIINEKLKTLIINHITK